MGCYGRNLKQMNKPPKCEYRSKLGPIPPDHFDNDPPFKPDSEIDMAPGSLYDHLGKRIKQRLNRIIEKRK